MVDSVQKMPNGPCPHCAAESPLLLQAISRIAFVNYYRCPECHQVWTVTKNGSGRILDYVTNLPGALTRGSRTTRVDRDDLYNSAPRFGSFVRSLQLE